MAHLQGRPRRRPEGLSAGGDGTIRSRVPQNNVKPHPLLDRARAEELLATAAQLQAAFWDALLELEGALGGIEVDGNRDLSEATIDELLVERDTDSGN